MRFRLKKMIENCKKGFTKKIFRPNEALTLEKMKIREKTTKVLYKTCDKYRRERILGTL